MFLNEVQYLSTHGVVAVSSIPQDGFADKRHVNGSLQETEKRQKKCFKVIDYIKSVHVQI